jgi:hypothetical protein
VREILKPLQYSGLSVLMRPDFRLSIDADTKRWTAHNLHRFDEHGEPVLEQGREGLCGDLATYVAHRLRPLLGEDRFTIEFVRVAESQFFPASISAHYVLRITELVPPNPPVIYILDPSFKRYGRLEEFDDYLFYEPRSEMLFVEKQDPDETFPVGEGTPILIHSRQLIGLAVNRDGRFFNRDYHRLSLVVVFRHRYAGRTMLMLRRRKGRVEIVENPRLAAKAMRRDEYVRLRDRVIELFNTMDVRGGLGTPEATDTR